MIQELLNTTTKSKPIEIQHIIEYNEIDDIYIIKQINLTTNITTERTLLFSDMNIDNTKIQLLKDVLIISNNNKTKAAKLIGIGKRYIFTWMKKIGLESSQ